MMNVQNQMNTNDKLPVTELCEDLFRICIPLQGNPLRSINAYLIRGNDRNLLIDTGYNMDYSIQIVKDSMAYLGAAPEDTDILLTHFHNDHSGASTSLIHPSRKIYVPIQERNFFAIGSNPEYYKECRRPLYTSEGVTEEFFDQMMDIRKAPDRGADFFSSQFEFFDADQVFEAGKYRLTSVHTPGHSPGHMCFWNEKNGIMFTGDHILFDITPNIVPWPGIPNVLAIYMFGLRKLQDYPVAVALPGHRDPGDFQGRIEAQLKHHEHRLNECESIIKLYPKKTAFEITDLLSWKIYKPDGSEGIPLSLLRYAYGECICHLDYLRFQKRVDRVMEDGFYRYI